jgi:hypothetical protein
MHVLLTSDVSQKRQNRETKCRTSDEYVILLHKQLLLYRIYAKKVLLDGTNTRLYRNKHQPLLSQTLVSVVLNTSLRHIKHQSPMRRSLFLTIYKAIFQLLELYVFRYPPFIQQDTAFRSRNSVLFCHGPEISHSRNAENTICHSVP